jgi:hypothetical protein
LRLCHREAREDFTGEQAGQVAVLLILSAEPGQYFGVAGVGGLGSEHDRRPRAAAEYLVDQCELDRAEALPAEFGPQMRRPQSVVTNLLFERVDDSATFVIERQEFAAGKQHLQRLHLLPNELANPVEALLELRFGGEVPCHVESSFIDCGDPLRPASPRLRSPLD